MTQSCSRILLVATVVVVAIAAVQAESYPPKETLERLFDALEEKGGKEALDAIKTVFRPDETSAGHLALKIDEMLATVGALRGHEFVGSRAIGHNRKYIELAYLSYHDLGPVMWEATAYRPGETWMILKLKFSTENLTERAEGYGALTRDTKETTH